MKYFKRRMISLIYNRYNISIVFLTLISQLLSFFTWKINHQDCKTLMIWSVVFQKQSKKKSLEKGQGCFLDWIEIYHQVISYAWQNDASTPNIYKLMIDFRSELRGWAGLYSQMSFLFSREEITRPRRTIIISWDEKLSVNCLHSTYDLLKCHPAPIEMSDF